MNTEQFIKLTEAYGADIMRWPEAYQKQAAKVIVLNLPEINLTLEQARSLDAMLSSHEISSTEHNLFENIVANAPKEKYESFWQRFNISGWIGLSSLIGTGLAGSIAGAFFVSIWSSAVLPENAEGTGSIAQYVDVGQEWS